MHGKLGYYVGRALLHYHCHTVYMVDSRATSISDCLAWFLVNLKMPGTSLIKQELDRFLQYANKWPNATMRIRASNMKLLCHSDGPI